MSDFAPITTTDGFSVKELANVPPDLLFTKDSYRRIKMLAHEMLVAGEPWDASQMSEILHKHLGLVQKTEENRQMFKEYTAIAYSLPFLYMLSLDTKELEDLFKFNFVSGIKIGIDVRYYVADLFKIMAREEDVLAIQNIIIQALYKNTEEIGTRKLQTGRDMGRPELRQWLFDYDSQFEGKRGSLEEVEYFNKSDNIQLLPPQDKEVLRKAIQAYDFIRYPFLMEAPESSELPPPPFEGEAREARPQIAQKPKTDYSDDYNTLPISLTVVQEKVNDLKGRSEMNPYIVTQILQNPEKVREKEYVVAALFLQIRNPRPPCSPQTSGQAKSPPALLAADERAGEIRNREELKNFIRALLETKLGWSAQDSAKLGIRVGNMLGDPYKGWAYYNKETGSFEWA